MASEIRVNQIQSRTGLSTISFTDTGPIISGVTTITNLELTNDIIANSNIGIGTDNPAQKLDVIGGNVRVGKTSNGKYIAENNLGQSKVLIDSSGTSYLNGGGVGIGTDNPNSRQLSVYGAGVNGAQIECRATGGNSSGLSMYAGRNFEIQSTTSVEANYPDCFIVYDRDANGYRMVIDGSGRVRTPDQPRFFAWSNTSQPVSSIGWTKATVWTATRHNVGSHFSTATDQFTAPIAGCYLFGATIRLDGMGGGYSRIILSVNGSEVYREQAHSITDSSGTTTDNYHTQAVTGFYDLSANDNVSVRVYSDTDTAYTIQSESQFWGILIA